jgi:Bacteriophage probable baseplate hub protein
MPETETQSQQNTQLLTPSFKILVDGQPLSSQFEARILSIKAESNLEILDMFEIRLYDFDLEIVNSDELTIGKQIEVKLGYQESQLTTVATCEIVSWEPEYPPSGAAYLTIRGYDKSFRLSREKKSRSFVEMKDSDIANEIAREMNLTPHVMATPEVHPFVFQRNQANLEFLMERAQRIMYEMYIDGSDLYFRPPLSDQTRQITLKWGESLVSFSPRLSSFNQVSEVVVKGWDPKTKKEIIGKAGGGDEHTNLGGAQTATELMEAAHGATKSFKVTQPIHSQAEADSLALAHFNRLSMGFITGDGRALGDPAIKAGAVIEMQGLGDKFTGSYYVAKATHIFTASGYITNFEVKKNSLGTPPAPVDQQAETEQEQNQSTLDVTLKDTADSAVGGMEYVVIAPDGTRYTGTVGSDGNIHHDNLPAGDCQIIFKRLTNAHWEADMVKVGDEMRLLVDCPAHDEGDAVTFEIYKQFKEGSDDIITTLNGTVNEQSQADATWTYEYVEEDEGTKPKFVFKAKAGSLEIMSDALTVVDVFEADLTDSDGQSVTNRKYILTLPDGSTREGISDSDGKVVEEELPVGDLQIRLDDGSTLEMS